MMQCAIVMRAIFWAGAVAPNVHLLLLAAAKDASRTSSTIARRTDARFEFKLRRDVESSILNTILVRLVSNNASQHPKLLFQDWS